MRIDYSLEEKFRLIRFILLASMLLGVVFAAFMLWRTVSLLRVAAKASGVVVEEVRRSSQDGGTSYAPRVRFHARDGKAVDFVSSISSSPPRYVVGDRVSVIYDPANPSRARINSFWDLWFLPMILGVLSMFNLVLYWALGLYRERIRAKSAAAAGP